MLPVQLTPELQAAQAPIQAAGQAALPVPNALPSTPDLSSPAAPPPGATTGLAGPLQSALAKPSNGVPLTFNDKLKQGVNDAAGATPAPVQATPGNWARQILAGAVHALGTAGPGLQNAAADIANAKVEPNSGIFGGLVAQQAAKANRQVEQQKAQTEQDKAKAEIAATNVQRMYHQTVLHQLSDEINQKDIAYGKSQLDSMTTHLTSLGLKPADVVAKDLIESQLTKAINDKNWDPTTETYYPTGSIEVPGKKDEAGNPLLQKTYTIVKVPATQTLTKDQVDRINKFVPGVKFDPENPPSMAGSTALNLMEQAHTAETVQDQRDHQLSQADADTLKEMDTKTAIAARDADSRLAKNTEYMKALSQAKGNLQGVYEYLQTKDPQGATDLVTSYGGPKGYQAVVEKQNADRDKDRAENEKERHDKIIESQNALKEKDKQDKDNAYKGDENAATPEAFLASLNPDDRGIVESLGTGRMDAGRMAYLLARNPNLVAAVTRAYPGFDNSKVAGYANVVKDFTSGKVGESLKSGATAFNHLKELHDLNTYESRIPGTADYQKYQNKLDVIASELANFYGDTTIPAIEGYKKTLGAFANRDAAIFEQAKSMRDRYDNIKQQWISAAPSDKYYGMMPDINQKAKNDLQSLLDASAGVKTPQGGPGSSVSHAVNDVVSQNGHSFKVTSVDANGKIIGTEPIGPTAGPTAAPAGAK
jgi:hypothetical protein